MIGMGKGRRECNDMFSQAFYRPVEHTVYHIEQHYIWGLNGFNCQVACYLGANLIVQRKRVHSTSILLGELDYSSNILDILLYSKRAGLASISWWDQQSVTAAYHRSYEEQIVVWCTTIVKRCMLVYMLRFPYSVPQKTMKLLCANRLAQQHRNSELWNGFATLWLRSSCFYEDDIAILRIF